MSREEFIKLHWPGCVVEINSEREKFTFTHCGYIFMISYVYNRSDASFMYGDSVLTMFTKTEREYVFGDVVEFDKAIAAIFLLSSEAEVQVSDTTGDAQ